MGWVSSASLMPVPPSPLPSASMEYCMELTLRVINKLKIEHLDYVPLHHSSNVYFCFSDRRECMYLLNSFPSTVVSIEIFRKTVLLIRERANEYSKLQ